MLLEWLFFSHCLAKKYTPGQEIPVFANRIRPYRNPSETYDYFSLPFCRFNGSAQAVRRSFADAVLGNKVERTAVTLNFTVPVTDKTVCKVHLDAENVKVLTTAVEREFYYELYVDKLPVWALVGAGAKDNGHPFVFTRQHFNISYNNNRIIDVVLTAESPFKLEEGRDLKFTYSVEWHSTARGKADRMERYKNDQFFKSSVRYLSLVNSVVIVLALVVLTLVILLRALGNDLIRYQKESEINSFEVDFRVERGWKMLHADVFRTPPFVAAFSVFVGIGAHVMIGSLLFLFLVVVLDEFLDRSATVLLGFVSYTIGAFFGGYFGAGLYKRWGGRKWMKQLMITVFLFPVIFTVVEIPLNRIAIAYKSSQVFKFKTLMRVFLWYVAVVMPVTVFGEIVGRNLFFVGPNPTRVGMIKRTIPPTPFYLSIVFVALVINVLSFGATFMEIHYVLVALWQYRMIQVWGFSLIVAVLLLIVIACSTVVAVYLRLSHENYLWHWLSFLAPASVVFYVFFYSLYYFIWKTEMTGALQTVYFFTFSAILSCIIGVTCGFVGFMSSAWFVRRIYTNIKTD